MSGQFVDPVQQSNTMALEAAFGNFDEVVRG